MHVLEYHDAQSLVSDSLNEADQRFDGLLLAALWAQGGACWTRVVWNGQQRGNERHIGLRTPVLPHHYPLELVPSPLRWRVTLEPELALQQVDERVERVVRVVR